MLLPDRVKLPPNACALWIQFDVVIDGVLSIRTIEDQTLSEQACASHRCVDRNLMEKGPLQCLPSLSPSLDLALNELDRLSEAVFFAEFTPEFFRRPRH